MKKFKNQRGLAALEVVIVSAIVAIFATIAVPKIARILDKVQLDYEMKHLYSTLNLARSTGKSASYKTSIFENMPSPVNNDIEFVVNAKRNGYFFRRINSETVGHEHFLEKDFKISFNKGGLRQFYISGSGDFSGISGHYTLTSRLGFSTYVYINSVGRVSGDWNERDDN